jgi:hypothetical protein
MKNGAFSRVDVGANRDASGRLLAGGGVAAYDGP